MKLGWIFCLLAFLSLSARAYSGDWELVTRDGRDYVTLRSFCAFYHFPYPPDVQKDMVRMRNDKMSVTLRIDSREAFINGTRYWLSFGFRQNKDEMLLSRVDLVKLFEPVLRPALIDSKSPVLGVVIDPGHGGSDNGAISSRRVMEKDLTLDTALRLEKVLRAAGIRTVMTRRSDIYVDLYERAERAASYPGYIFVSLHFNSASPDARGLETYACSPRGAGSTQAGGVVTRADYQKVLGNDTDSLNVLLASEVHRCVTTLNPNDIEADRGLKRARFVVLKQNTVPSVLVEGGFLSHRMESSVLATPSYRQKLAEAVGKGILNFAAQMLPPEKRVTAPQVRPETPKVVTPTTTASAPSTPVRPAPAITTASAPVRPAPAPAPVQPTPAINPPVVTEPAPVAPSTSTASSTPASAVPPESMESNSEKPGDAPTISTTPPATSTTPDTTSPSQTTPERPAVTAPEPEPPTTIYPDKSSGPVHTAPTIETQP